MIMPHYQKLPSTSKQNRSAADPQSDQHLLGKSSLHAPAYGFLAVQRQEATAPPPNLSSVINATIKALNAEKDKPEVYIKHEGKIYLKPPKYSFFQKNPDFRYEEGLKEPSAEVVGVKGFTNFSVKVGKSFMDASPEQRKAMLKPALEAGIARYNKKTELEQISNQKGGFDSKGAETMVRHLLDLTGSQYAQYADLVKEVVYEEEGDGISMEGTRVAANVKVGKTFLSGINENNLDQKKEELQAAIQTYEQNMGSIEDRIVKVGSKESNDPTASTINSSEAIYRLINLYMPRYKEIIGGVGYKESTDQLEVSADNSLMITVGKGFLDNFTKENLPAKAEQLRQAILSNAQTESLLIKITGPQLIRDLIRKQMPKYLPIIDQIQYQGSDGVSVQKKGKKLLVSYGTKFGQDLIAEIKDKGKQQDMNRSLVNTLNYHLREPAEDLLKEDPSDFRKSLVDSLKYYANYDEDKGKYMGSTEGGERFAKFRSTEGLNAARKQSAVKGRTFTTCIDFQGHILGDATAKQKTSLKAGSGINIDEQAAEFGAWHPAYKDMPKTPRPKKGDVYLLTMSEADASFSHTGFINDITVHEDGTETWKTIDGGQGTSAKYVVDPNGAHEVTVTKTVDGETKVETVKLREERAGKEELKEVTRKYDPRTNIMSVPYKKRKGMTQDLRPRWLKGWVDIDKYVKKK